MRYWSNVTPSVELVSCLQVVMSCFCLTRQDFLWFITWTARAFKCSKASETHCLQTNIIVYTTAQINLINFVPFH